MRIEFSTSPVLWTSAPPRTVTRDSDRRTQAGRPSVPSTARSRRSDASRTESQTLNGNGSKPVSGLSTRIFPVTEEVIEIGQGMPCTTRLGRPRSSYDRVPAGTSVQWRNATPAKLPYRSSEWRATQNAVKREARRIRAAGIVGTPHAQPVGTAAAGLDRNDHGPAARLGSDLELLAGGELDVQVLAVDAVAGDFDHRGRCVTLLGGRSPGLQGEADACVALRADRVNGRGRGRKRALVAAAADRSHPQARARHRDLLLGRMPRREGDPAEQRIDADVAVRRALMPAAEVGYQDLRARYGPAAAVHADAARRAVVVL